MANDRTFVTLEPEMDGVRPLMRVPKHLYEEAKKIQQENPGMEMFDALTEACKRTKDE